MTPEIPGYRVETTLGTGGMATVYRAVQESLHRPVAVKVLNPAMSREADFARRFVQESRMVAALVHPHIVTVHEAGHHGDLHFMAMELLPGGSLGEHLAAGRAGDVGHALAVARCLASALAYAHRRGIVHRDVKPANVLFREDGTPVLTDFGVARRLDEITCLTRQGLVVGSPGYMSPEQIRGEPADARSDLYSLGVVLYQLLVGQAPYRVPTGDPFATAQRQLTQPVPHLPPQLRRFQPLVEGLLARSPEDRLPGAAPLLEQLDALRAGTADATVVRPAAPRTPAPRGTARSRRWPWWAGAAALGLAAAGAHLAPPLPPSPSPPPAAQAPPPEPGAAGPAQRRRLLDEAATRVAAGRLIEPPGDSALHLYRQVLARWPGHPEALEGMTVLRGQLRHGIRASLEAGEARAALATTEKALEVWPDSLALQGLASQARESLAAPRAAAQSADRQAQLLARAEGQLTARRLTRPAGDNALETYHEILRLDPGSARARAGLRRIADAYLELAHRARARGEPDAARSYVERGLAVTPAHPGLLRWRAEAAASADFAVAGQDLRSRSPLGHWLDQQDLTLGLRPLEEGLDARRLRAGDAFVLVLRSRSGEGYLTLFNIYQDGRVAPLAGNEPMAPVVELPSREQQARGLVITAGLLEPGQPTRDIYLALRSEQPLDTRELGRAVRASPGAELTLDDFLAWAAGQPVRAAALARVAIDP